MCTPLYYHTGQGISTTSYQISFEFLFIKTHPPHKLMIRFRFADQFYVGIRSPIRPMDLHRRARRFVPKYRTQKEDRDTSASSQDELISARNNM